MAFLGAPRRRLALAAALALPASAARASIPAPAPAPRYDILYLWHGSLAQAQQRREALSRVLGPRVARDLRLIDTDGGYGVVYLRRGDARGAIAAAAQQARLLNRKNLGKAWPVAARAWIEAAPPEAASGSAAPAAAVASRPAAAARFPAPDRRSAERRQLEDLLEEHVLKLRRAGRLAPDERAAWSVYDLTTNEELAAINADLKLQTASLVKPFLALAYLSRVEKGQLAYDDQARRQMTRMIQASDNAAADWVMRRLGGPAAVERQLKAEFGEILSGVEIHEYIPRSGRTFRNKATARDYNRFLLALWRDRLPGSAEIKRLMALPKRDRLRTGVPLPEDMQVIDKTGTTSRLVGDIGVLTAKGKDGRSYSYAMVGIIEKDRSARNYYSWMRSRGNVIRYVSYLVYRRVGARDGFVGR